jgi:hypothetical protein
MKPLVIAGALFVSAAWSYATTPERNNLSIQGEWRIDNDTLHLRIENHGITTLLMDDPSDLVPNLIIADGDFKGLPSVIAVDPKEWDSLFAHSLLNNRAFWLVPIKVNKDLAMITWRIKLAPEAAAQLRRSTQSQLELSGLDGSVVRDLTMDAKSMLLTRFTTTLRFEYSVPESKDKNAEQPGAGQPATKSADKVPAEAQPPTPTSKDCPR